MASSVIRMPTNPTADNALAVDVPEWITGREIREQHDDHAVTVRLTADSQDALEQWAVEQGYATPERVDRGRFMLALMAKDPDVFAAVKQIIASSEQMRLAASIPYYRRSAPLIGNLSAQLRAMGFIQVTDEWVDELFRDGVLLEP